MVSWKSTQRAAYCAGIRNAALDLTKRKPRVDVGASPWPLLSTHLRRLEECFCSPSQVRRERFVGEFQRYFFELGGCGRIGVEP